MPRNEDSLLAAIRAAPDDDGPRLVWADAIVGRDPERAELVIAQCELARGASPEREKQLRSREDVLLLENEDRWVLFSPYTVEGAFRRGFLADVRIYRGLSPAEIDSLLRSDAGVVLESIRAPEIGGGDGLAKVVAAAACPRALRRLDLRACGVGAAGAEALAGVAWTRLERLDLRDNPLGEAGRKALAGLASGAKVEI